MAVVAVACLCLVLGAYAVAGDDGVVYGPEQSLLLITHACMETSTDLRSGFGIDESGGGAMPQIDNAGL